MVDLPIQVGLVGCVAVLSAVWVAWLGSLPSIELSSLPHVSVLDPKLKAAAATRGTFFSWKVAIVQEGKPS